MNPNYQQQQPKKPQPLQIDFSQIVKQIDPTAEIDPTSNSILNSITQDFFAQILKEANAITHQSRKKAIDDEVMKQVVATMKYNHTIRATKNMQKPAPSPVHNQRMEMIRNFKATKAALEGNE